MGCDIHLFIEYDVSTRPEGWKHNIPAIQEPVTPFSRREFIKSLADDQFMIPRHYALFTAIAGVRRGEDDKPPLYAPRGFPSPASQSLLVRYYHYVMDPEEGEATGDGEISRAHAEDFVARGMSHYIDHPKKPRGFVSDPGAHTPSWLLLSEFRAALAHHGLEARNSSIELHALLVAAEELERGCGEGRVRVVFWFDN